MAARQSTPGGLLLHPVALLSIAALVLNDHVLKLIFAGFVTGKISDVAGLIFFPLLIASLVEVLASLAGRRLPRPHLVLAASLLTALGFAFVKSTPLGADAFAWTLGIGQWLVVGGPFRGFAPAPTASLVDLSDLLALPGVMVAIAIGWSAQIGAACPPERAMRRPSLATILAIVLAGLASLGSEPGMAWKHADSEQIIHLTSQQPVVRRHISYDVTNRDPSVTAVILLAEIPQVPTTGGGALPDNVALTLVPDIATNDVTSGDGTWATLPISRALDVTAGCSRECHGGATAEVRLSGGSDAADADAHLHVQLLASTDHEGDSVDADLAIRFDDSAGPDVQPTSLVVTSERTFRVGSVEGAAHFEIKLRIAPEALVAPLSSPLAGRLVTSIATTGASGHPNAHVTTVSMGQASQLLVGDEQPWDVDWLQQCLAATPCEITIALDSSYDPTLNSENFDPADPAARGWVELKWTVEARLDAFDGRPLPSGALTLEGP